MKIQTDLDNGNYKRFKELAEKLEDSEYKLAQDAILVYINEYGKIMDKKKEIIKVFSTRELLQELWNRIP